MKIILILTLILYIASTLCVVVSHLKKYDRLAAFSSYMLYIGVLFHTFGLILVTYTTGHMPMGSVFETLLFYSWFTALLSAIVVWRYKERLTELITIPIALAALLVVCMNKVGGGELPLILKTRWFEVHVLSSFAAYSFFTLAFSGALLYIFLRKKLNEDTVKSFQDIAGKGVLWGFFFFSASMFAGAVWAYLAWGIYWLWEPKVLWSFIVWFWFAGVMHAWHVREWKGMGLCIATVLGFFVTVFTYLGVGLLMKSSHSF